MAVEVTGNQPMSFTMRTTVYGIKKKFPSVRNISCQELDLWRKSERQRELIILDTRPLEEYEVSHIPNSMRVEPEGDYDLKTLGLSETSTVLCYCSVGYRSSNVAQKLFKLCKHSQDSTHKHSQDSTHKPLDVYNLEGGVFQWACEGRDLINAAGDRVTSVHPYSSYWGMLLPTDLRHNLKSKV